MNNSQQVDLEIICTQIPSNISQGTYLPSVMPLITASEKLNCRKEQGKTIGRHGESNDKTSYDIEGEE